MDIVLGVSMTPTTVRMVLVEGDKADGSIVDHDVFDVTAADGTATSSNAAEQVVEGCEQGRGGIKANMADFVRQVPLWQEQVESGGTRSVISGCQKKGGCAR